MGRKVEVLKCELEIAGAFRDLAIEERDSARRWSAAWKRAAKHEKLDGDTTYQLMIASANQRDEARAVARRLLKERDEARADNARLREALEQVEWHGYYKVCPWCRRDTEHKPDCIRQRALGLAK